MPKYGRNLLDELFPLLNMGYDMKLLFTINLVQEFICSSSHFLAVISSPQGSGKSTFTNMWRQIVDPAQAVITTMPDNVDSLKNHLANNIMCCFDNTQQLNAAYSDILCGAVTGTYHTKRKLYTDSDEIVIKLHNIVVLNGIDIIPSKSDLLERSLLFKLNTISSADRKSENEIKEKFSEALPYVLGAIFDILVEYFKRKDEIEVKGSHRMAGAYRDCYVIASILDVADDFVIAFQNNQKLLKNNLIESNPLVSAIDLYMRSLGQKQKKCTMTTLYDEIKKLSDIDTFPKNSSAFSRALKNQEPALEQAGYTYSRLKGRKNTTVIIKKKNEY